jgi:glycosyltransferase involved in cell wall biosynthesis
MYEDRGTPIAVLEVLKVLSEQGWQVHLLTYPLGSDIALPGLTIFRTSNPFRIRFVPIGFSIRKLLFDLLLVRATWHRLRVETYSAIHAVEEMGFPAALLGSRARVPVLWDMQSDMPEQMKKKRVFRLAPLQALLRGCERWLIRNVQLIACSSGLSEHVTANARHAVVFEWRYPWQSGSPSPRFKVTRESLGIPPGAPLIVYTGNMAPYQGIPVLIDATKLVLCECPEAVLLLVGIEPGDRLPAAARTLVARGSVRTVGRQPRQAIPAYLALADVLVSPRVVDGNIPLKVFDYMASGKPIVATNIHSHRSVLNPERAFLVTPTKEGLARGILEVLRDIEAAQVRAGRARRYAEEHLSAMEFSRTVKRMYDELTTQQRRSG